MAILLRLSENFEYVHFSNEAMLKNVTWIKEKTFAQISLSSLTIFMLTRLLQANLFGTKDLYIHEMSLAILQNHAPNVTHLDSFVSDRYLGLLEAVFKRLVRLLQGPSLSSPFADESSLLSAALYTVIC